MPRDLDISTANISADTSVSVPAAARDGVRREIAGIPECTTSTRQVVADHIQESRALSAVDSAAQVVERIRALRDEQAGQKFSGRTLEQAVSEIVQTMSSDDRRAVLAALPDTASVREAVFKLALKLQTATPPTADPHKPIVADRNDALEDDELAESRLASTSFRSMLQKSFERLWSAAARLLANGARAAREMLGRARSKGRPEEGRPVVSFYVPASSDPVKAPILPQPQFRLSDEWRTRFSDEPAKGVKEAVVTLSKVLEDFARGKRCEEHKNALEQKSFEQLERERMNKLRDSLAKLLVPMNDGNIPLSLLSRHFVGPWLTEEDLLAAIETARHARGAHKRAA